MSEELKRCPFCGGEAEVSSFNNLPFDCGVIVTCRECGIALHESSRNGHPNADTRRKAVKRWNQRVYEDEITELKRGVIRNPENAFVMGYPMLKLLVLVEVLDKKGVSYQQVDDFIADVGNIYDYFQKEHERMLKESLESAMSIGKVAFDLRDKYDI